MYLRRKTRRLFLRPLARSDYDAWRLAWTSMLPQRTIWDRSNRSPKEVTRKRFLEVLKSQAATREQDQFYDIAVFEKSSGRLIGSVSAMDIGRGPGQSAYLGYLIYNNYWGQGYGKEAVLAMIDIAFRDIKLHRIEAGIEPTNRRSIMLARSLGLRKEGLKKRALYLRGKWNDLAMYSATCEEFRIKWKGKTETRLR